jgi:RimJ/RimL family protein N-acetyltransferase
MSGVERAARVSDVLQTERLVLRELSPADLDSVAEMLADTEVMRYWPRPQTRDESRAWIERQQERYARDGHGYWLMLEREGRTPVGQAGLMTIDVQGEMLVGLGYIVHRPFWRRGYATEASAGCLDHAFGPLGLERVIALIRPENEPSVGVADKLHMTPCGRTQFAGFEHLIREVLREGWRV